MGLARARTRDQLGHEPQHREHRCVQKNDQHSAYEERHRSTKIDPCVNRAAAARHGQRILALEDPALAPPARGSRLAFPTRGGR
jgi:hypothetical protein